MTLVYGESFATNVRCQSFSFFYPAADVTNPVLSNVSGY
jgi:hypothetical protein